MLNAGGEVLGQNMVLCYTLSQGGLRYPKLVKKVASEAALAEKAGWDEWKERRRHFRKRSRED